MNVVPLRPKKMETVTLITDMGEHTRILLDETDAQSYLVIEYDGRHYTKWAYLQYNETVVLDANGAERVDK